MMKELDSNQLSCALSWNHRKQALWSWAWTVYYHCQIACFLPHFWCSSSSKICGTEPNFPVAPQQSPAKNSTEIINLTFEYEWIWWNNACEWLNEIIYSPFFFNKNGIVDCRNREMNLSGNKLQSFYKNFLQFAW